MDDRLFFSATQRNKAAIGDVLSTYLPDSGTVLEIASGSGEHAVSFQTRFPNINWQTSECNPTYRKSISAWINYQGLSAKMEQPLDLDVEKKPWPLTSKLRTTLNGIVCINMIHISPWSCTKSLIYETSTILKSDQFLILYGPFKRNNKHISHSNFQFDIALRSQNPTWGVRNLDEVCKLATENGFKNPEVIEMPANNLSIIFHRK